jgi:PAS domain S-box-containing protein
MTTVRQTEGASGLFWMAFKHSANAMLLLDGERRITEVNEAAITLFGYSREEIVGRTCERFIAPRNWRQAETDWRTIMREGEVTTSREVVRQDGTRVDVQFAARQEVVTGQRLVLYVVVEQHLRPVLGEDVKRPVLVPTPRELEIISLLAMGYRVHEIATELYISPATVQTHVRKAMAKLGTRSQAHLVARAMATGMLNPNALRPRPLALSA